MYFTNSQLRRHFECSSFTLSPICHATWMTCLALKIFRRHFPSMVPTCTQLSTCAVPKFASQPSISVESCTFFIRQDFDGDLLVSTCILLCAKQTNLDVLDLDTHRGRDMNVESQQYYRLAAPPLSWLSTGSAKDPPTIRGVMPSCRCEAGDVRTSKRESSRHRCKINLDHHSSYPSPLTEVLYKWYDSKQSYRICAVM